MSNTTSPSRPASAGGARSGRVIVGDFISCPAADAARAVRRAGLRPGLERSFDCEAHLLGQIVAQEPAAGKELARGAMVMLYVGAPAAAPASDEAEPHPHAHTPGEGGHPYELTRAAPMPTPRGSTVPVGGHLEGRTEAGEQDSEERGAPRTATDSAVEQAAASRSDTLKRRKPRHAQGSSTEPAAPAPEPRPPLDRREVGGEGQGQGEDSSTDTRVLHRPSGVARVLSPPTDGEDPISEELLSHADDIFGGRAGAPPPRRHSYLPRGETRRLERSLRWALRHPVLAATTSAMLVLWGIVGLHGALAPAPKPTSAPVNPRSAVHRVSPQQADAVRPLPTSRADQAPGRARSTSRDERAGAGEGTLARLPSAKPTAPRAQPAPALEQQRPTPKSAPERTPAPQAPEPQQRTGGPFSP